MHAPEQAVPWDEGTSDAWFQEVERWRWEYDPEKNEYLKAGECPRCAPHLMGKTLSAWTVLAEDDKGKADNVDIYCNCDHQHPGRPPGKSSGCGYGAWGFTHPASKSAAKSQAVTATGGGTAARAPYDKTQRQWTERAEQLQFTALDSVRSSAEKWGTTITALTGVFGLTALLKGPGEVSVLTPDCRVVVGLLLLATALLAAGAITLAAMAAQGIPEQVEITGPKLRELHKTAARTAGSRLTWSRGLALGSLAALAVAIGLTWYGPREPSALGHAWVIQQSGPALCGELTSDEQGRLGLRVRGRDTTMLNQVLSISRTEKCP